MMLEIKGLKRNAVSRILLFVGSKPSVAYASCLSIKRRSLEGVAIP